MVNIATSGSQSDIIMQIKLATALALLPFLVSAAPAPVDKGMRIPLTKRSMIFKNGVVDLDALQSHRSFIQGYV